MTRSKTTKAGKFRLSLELSPRMNAKLEKLSSDTGESKTTTIRKSLALYDAVLAAVASGRKIIFKDQDGQERTIEIL